MSQTCTAVHEPWKRRKEHQYISFWKKRSIKFSSLRCFPGTRERLKSTIFFSSQLRTPMLLKQPSFCYHNQAQKKRRCSFLFRVLIYCSCKENMALVFGDHDRDESVAVFHMAAKGQTRIHVLGNITSI